MQWTDKYTIVSSSCLPLFHRLLVSSAPQLFVVTLGVMDTENSMLRNIGLVRHRGPSRRKMSHPNAGQSNERSRRETGGGGVWQSPSFAFLHNTADIWSFVWLGWQTWGIQSVRKNTAGWWALYMRFPLFYDIFAVLKPTSICVTLQSFDEEEFHLAALWMNLKKKKKKMLFLPCHDPYSHLSGFRSQALAASGGGSHICGAIRR